MAEPHDTRPWQAAVDPALLAHLRRPLRRSAALGCAWAREALARARLVGLPLFDSWAVRWGVRAAELAQMHPIVHALPRDEHEPPGRPPSVAATPGPIGPRPRVAATPVMRPGEPASGPLVAMQERRVEPSAPASPAAPAARGLDLRVDPSLLAASRPSPVPPTTISATATVTATDHRPEEALAPRRRPPRSRVVTTWDLAREQPRAAASEPSPVTPTVQATIAAEPIAQATIATVPIVQPTIAAPIGPATIAATPIATSSAPTMQVASPMPPRAASLPVARDIPSAPPATREPRELPSALPAARPRVHARQVAPPIVPVLSDSHAIPPPRPRVPASTTAAPTPTAIVAPAAPGLDLTVPFAAARVSASPPAAAPAPPAPPVAAPVRAVATGPAALDIPAIAEAVQRHLDRRLRWERERRGGRP